MELELLRVENTKDHTIGVLRIKDTQIEIARTMEDAWKDNARNISCIPKGTYKVVRHTSPKYGNCFMVSNVPNRDYILIHAGNYATDTEGCILLGESVATNVAGKRMVTNSKVTVSKFMNLMREVSEFTLTVKEV